MFPITMTDGRYAHVVRSRETGLVSTLAESDDYPALLDAVLAWIWDHPPVWTAEHSIVDSRGEYSPFPMTVRTDGHDSCHVIDIIECGHIHRYFRENGYHIRLT